jgi:hypothetical protein
MRLRTASLTFAVSLAIVAPTFSARTALAQSDDDRATARALGMEGQQALDAKDYGRAEDRFRRADKLVHAPTLELGLARALAAGGKFVEAQETYNRIVREGLPPGAPEVFKKALDDARKEVDSVSPKVGGVTITVKASAGGDVADPKVVLDEHPINSASLGVRRAIDPGSHVLRVAADGYKAAEVHFTVQAGGAIDEPVTLDKDTGAPAPVTTPAPTPVTPTPAATPGPASTTAPDQTATAPKHSILPWVAFGIGGAGLVAGAITGLIAVGDHSKLQSNCTNGTCGPSQQDNLNSYHTMGTISTIGFVVAGVGAAAGVILLVTQPKGENPSAAPAASGPAAQGLHVVPVIGLGSVGAVGTF